MPSPGDIQWPQARRRLPIRRHFGLGSIYATQLRRASRRRQRPGGISLRGIRYTLLVVVGYAGAEEGVMRVLVDAAHELGEKTIFWCQYGDNPDDLSVLPTEFLIHSPGGGLLVGQDADKLFAELIRGVGLGLPRWVKQPVRYLHDQHERVVIPANTLIQQEMENHSRVLDFLNQALKRREKERGKKLLMIEEARALALQGKDLQAAKLLGRAQSAFQSWQDWQIYGDIILSAGETSPEGHLLEKAQRAYEQALAGLSKARKSNGIQARLQSRLAHALYRLGEREPGTERLQEAAELSRITLDFFTRENFPLDWAVSQNNLGNALTTLGEREDGTETLQKAVHAFSAALEVHERETHPLAWATTQNNLGTALSTLGEREERTGSLEKAVQAYYAALEVRTRDSLPLAWATTQNNLGNALLTLGEREKGTQILEMAVQAYSAALEVRTRDSLPLAWASTQHNLGSALRVLGEHDKETETLQKAAQACHAALEVRTRDSLPLAWAMTQTNLASILTTLGEREMGAETIRTAVATYSAALEVHTRDSLPLHWAVTKSKLGNALRALGEREADIGKLEQAVAAIESVLDLDLQKHSPWLSTENLLRYGQALRALGELQRDPTLIGKAMGQLAAARKAYIRFGSRYWSSRAQQELATARSVLAQLA